MLRLMLIVGVLTLTQFGLSACVPRAAIIAEKNATDDQVSTDKQSSVELIEGFFVAPGINFAHYNQVIITDLKLDNIRIEQPASNAKQAKQNSAKTLSGLVLSADDKQFYRSQYVAAVINNLIADGAYATSIDTGNQVLLLRAAIVKIIPPVTQVESTSRQDIQAYAEKLGAVTITIELFDSQTQQLLATLTDTRELGSFLQNDNRLTYNNQVQLAFDYWLGYIRLELNELSQATH